MKEKSTNYNTVHWWLRYTYGSPKKCAHCPKTEKIEWALRTGFKHKQDKKHYIGLCRKCHFKYDKHPFGGTAWNKGLKGDPRLVASAAKAREALKGKPVWNKGKKTGIVPKSAFKKGGKPWNKGMALKEKGIL